MPITPLPQFEADLEADRKLYESLKPPTSMVVRFGDLKLVGEFPYSGDAKPGCGSKLVVRTFRGTEVGEMLTTTCGNSGCSKSVSRQEMLRYIDNSGGRDYPFYTDGRVLRVATKEDLDKQTAIEQSRHGLKMAARRAVESLGLTIKIVDAEPILGGERLTIYYNSEDRPDLRELARMLGVEFHVRVELRQVGARDEARLTADYERCGQYCCCKNFLKVLKPISMRAAKMQKATLDPLKISGRCGRLMCCLRYEDETYEELRKKLPKRKTRVGTPEGNGFVVDSQILTQLVLVHLDGSERQVAIPVEDLTEPTAAAPEPPPLAGPPADRRGARPRDASPRDDRAREPKRREGEAVPRREGEPPRSEGDLPRPAGPVRERSSRRSDQQPRSDQPQQGNRPPRGDQPRRDDRPRRDEQARPANQPSRDDGSRQSERPPRQDQPPDADAIRPLDDDLPPIDTGMEADDAAEASPGPESAGTPGGPPRRRRRRRRRRPPGDAQGGSQSAPPGSPPPSPAGPA
ncbi:MAG: regulatory iron-sulfur-containing complex subunit RicT [Phycisphaerales bacterium]